MNGAVVPGGTGQALQGSQSSFLLQSSCFLSCLLFHHHILPHFHSQIPGKKKSKFKALKSFFGKKKKKEPEDAHRGRRLKPKVSSTNINISSLKPIQADQQTEPR